MALSEMYWACSSYDTLKFRIYKPFVYIPIKNWGAYKRGGGGYYGTIGSTSQIFGDWGGGAICELFLEGA